MLNWIITPSCSPRAPAESYRDTGNRAMFANAAQGAPPSGGPFLPSVTDPARVFPLWRHLAARAGLGPAADAPCVGAPEGLALLAGERRLRPVLCSARQAVFALPPMPGALRLACAADRPSRLRPWLDDRRRLGVAVRRACADGTALPLDGPAFGDGWWPIEPGAFRWSNGRAALTPPDGSAVLTLDLQAVMVPAGYSAARAVG